MKKFTKIFWKVITILALIIVGIIDSIIVLVFLAIFESFLFPNKKPNPYKYVKSNITIDVSSCKNIENVYQYFRDGNAFMSFDCTDADITNQVDTWRTLPLSENLNEMIYNRLSLDKKYNFTKPENGYYYFIDRYTRQYKDNDDIYSDEMLLQIETRYATNFTVAIYDSDNSQFYYYQLDT